MVTGRPMVIGLVILCALSSFAVAETIHVTPETFTAALEKANPGDTILMADGSYKGGVEMSRSGTEAAPITIKAESTGAIVDGGRKDGFVVGGDWVVVEGIRFQNAGRGGIGFLSSPEKPSEHDTVRNCVFADNGVWGLITSHTNHLLIENCEAFGSKEQHGIYFSNSGDDPVIRNNHVHDNNMCGIHMNGDPECGGDGIISRLLAEGNVIWRNGREGGSALNITHVQDSLYRNNLAYANLAMGIVTYYDTGGEKCASKRNQFYNNTIVFNPGEGRWCLSLQKSSTDAIVKNNLFVGGKYGVIWVRPDSLAGLTINNNVYATYPEQVLIGNASEPSAAELAGYREQGIGIDDKGVVSIESWRKKGYDTDSKIGEMPKFVDAAKGDYHLAANSVGVGNGADLGKLVTTDIEGAPRPAEKGWDCGCYQTTKK